MSDKCTEKEIADNTYEKSCGCKQWVEGIKRIQVTCKEHGNAYICDWVKIPQGVIGAW